MRCPDGLAWVSKPLTDLRSVDTILDLVVGNQLEIMTETRWKQPNDSGRDYQLWLNGCHCQIQNIGEFPGDLRTPPKYEETPE